MDKGVLQREQALKLKRIVSQTKSKRRQRQLLNTAQSPQDLRPDMDPLPIEIISSLTLPSSSSTHGTVEERNDNAPQDDLQFQISERDLGAFSEPMWSVPFYNTIFPAESFFIQEGDMPASNQCLSSAAAAIENGDLESNSLSSGSSEGVSASSPTSASEREDNAVLDDGVYREDAQFELGGGALSAFGGSTWSTSYHDGHLSRESTAINQMGSASSSQNYSSLISGPFEHFASRPTEPSESVIFGNEEDILFIHYLDRTFYIQYPFYHSHGIQGRGWLFSILRRVKSAYHASLALSEYHRYSTLPQHGGITSIHDHLPAKDGHYELALLEMQRSIGESHTWSRTPGLIRTVEVLTCILQLLFLEVC
jgi:hypothetical protein